MQNTQKINDKVNHPSHYTWLKKLCGIEVIDITRHMCFNLGNVVKYVLRAGHKSEEGYSDLDKEIEDLKKAKWYLEDEIKLRSGEDTSEKAQLEALKAEIASNMEIIANQKETIRRLTSDPIVGELKLSKKEILNINLYVADKLIQDPIKITQTGGSGIGLGTKLEYTYLEGDKIVNNSVDVTDYAAW